VLTKTEIMAEIEKRVKESAEARRQDAGMSGSMSDGGASESINKLNTWLDGINFAKTGTSNTYRELIQTIENEVDPDYIEYQRLKEKFEK